MPLFAEIGPLELDPYLREEADKIVLETTEKGQPMFDKNLDTEENVIPIRKEFKIMSVNKIHFSSESSE